MNDLLVRTSVMLAHSFGCFSWPSFSEIRFAKTVRDIKGLGWKFCLQ